MVTRDVSLIDHPFAPLFLPGEEIIWTAKNTPARPDWRSGLATLAGGIALLALFGPELFSVLKTCFDAGSTFPLQFLGAWGVFGLVAPVLLGIWIVWIAGELFQKCQTFIYGLSQTRAFIAKDNPNKRWISSSVVQVGGTVEMVQDTDRFNLMIPISHTGEDDSSLEFVRISRSEIETALALVNKIVGGSAL